MYFIFKQIRGKKTTGEISELLKCSGKTCHSLGYLGNREDEKRYGDSRFSRKQDIGVAKVYDKGEYQSFGLRHWMIKCCMNWCKRAVQQSSIKHKYPDL